MARIPSLSPAPAPSSAPASSTVVSGTGPASRTFVVISNTHGANFVEQKLATLEWLRMMSDRDDARGRRADARTVDVSLLQAADGIKEDMRKQSVSKEQFVSASLALNPYAGLTRSVFGGLSAVALGHVDFLLRAVAEYTSNKGVLRFVDVGSCQGALSEYILWRASSQSKLDTRGWYFGNGSATASKVGRRMLAECRAAERLDEFSGAAAATAGSGGVLDPANIDAFVQHVRASNDQKHVDLVVAENDSLEQGDLALGHEKHQYAYTIAQAIVAFQILRRGGTFVFKVYDTATPLSVELLYLIHACFERMAIVRPLASRPTSTERFVVCNNLNADPARLVAHFTMALGKMHDGSLKPSHLVSWTKVSAERQFMGPLGRINNKIAQEQVQALKSVAAHIGRQQPGGGGGGASSANKNTSAEHMLTRQQEDVANLCLKTWGLPQLQL
ncbi:hypothetical protein GGF37_004539 [Kickxella alabastrina]|nr:hypothetical protein GGF37_004539 [Kickxella alabastrina]